MTQKPGDKAPGRPLSSRRRLSAAAGPSQATGVAIFHYGNLSCKIYRRLSSDVLTAACKSASVISAESCPDIPLPEVTFFLTYAFV